MRGMLPGPEGRDSGSLMRVCERVLRHEDEGRGARVLRHEDEGRESTHAKLGQVWKAGVGACRSVQGGGCRRAVITSWRRGCREEEAASACPCGESTTGMRRAGGQLGASDCGSAGPSDAFEKGPARHATSMCLAPPSSRRNSPTPAPRAARLLCRYRRSSCRCRTRKWTRAAMTTSAGRSGASAARTARWGRGGACSRSLGRGRGIRACRGRGSAAAATAAAAGLAVMGVSGAVVGIVEMGGGGRAEGVGGRLLEEWVSPAGPAGSSRKGQEPSGCRNPSRACRPPGDAARMQVACDRACLVAV
jgi:hypothetical protein